MPLHKLEQAHGVYSDPSCTQVGGTFLYAPSTSSTLIPSRLASDPLHYETLSIQDLVFFKTQQTAFNYGLCLET